MSPTPPLLSLIWCRFTWRHWRGAPASSALLVGIVALGVGVYFAVRLANRAAVASFQNFTDVLTAESDGLIQAPAGMLPESVLRELRAALGDTPVQLIPVVESTAARPRSSEWTSLPCRIWPHGNRRTGPGSGRIRMERPPRRACPELRPWGIGIFGLPSAIRDPRSSARPRRFGRGFAWATRFLWSSRIASFRFGLRESFRLIRPVRVHRRS